MPVEWAGEAPFFLIFERGPGDNVGIDVDQPGWIDEHRALFRSPGIWLLMPKRALPDGRPAPPLFAVILEEGDQFYFTKRHVGNLMASREVICWGIGKKQADGFTVNLWLLPNGMVCGGDDVDRLASRMV